MTRTELRALARTLLNDPAPGTRWTDAELNEWINEGLDAWTLATNQQTTTASPVASADLPATAFYTMPTDAVGPVRVQWQGRELPPMSVPWWQRWETETGTPTNVIWGPYGPNKFRIWPYQTSSIAADLTLFYVKRPPQMTADGDTPEMPTIFQRALAWYAVSEAYRKDADTASLDQSASYRAKFDGLVIQANEQQPVEHTQVPMRWL